MEAKYLKSKYDAGKIFSEYLASGSPAQRDNWQRVYDQAELSDSQRKLIQSFTRRINIIALAGIWCGDCAQQCPLIQRVADANPSRIDLRWLDRDAHLDLQDQLTINAGKRVPVVIFCAEDYEQVGWYGDRTLSRYRSLAAQQFGSSCPLPGATLDKDLTAAVIQEWLNEFERVHLLLRLSARLRQKHGD
jgi:hypothetical protein